MAQGVTIHAHHRLHVGPVSCDQNYGTSVWNSGAGSEAGSSRRQKSGTVFGRFEGGDGKVRADGS